ncbi:MAG: 16S rRNA (adenine(1518)-N(6)/adenine(1519)-N(6))-dimethyltransferase RsmA [Bacillota bacterium]
MDSQENGSSNVPSSAAIARLLRRYGLSPRHRLGQNFLVDPRVLEAILAAADLAPEDVVLEVGPGLGVLTEALAARAGAVMALELDPGLLGILRERLAERKNVRLIHGDALKEDLAALLDEAADGGPGCSKVVANLPYYITTPFLMRLLEETPGWERAVLMVQREVADRLLASPGGKDYGVLTLSVRYHARAELVTPVSRRAFWPSPEVESAVVRLFRRQQPPVPASPRTLFACIRAGFSQRRKTLANALGAGFGRERAAAALEAAAIDGRRRAETLSLEEFSAVAIALGQEP